MVNLSISYIKTPILKLINEVNESIVDFVNSLDLSTLSDLDKKILDSISKINEIHDWEINNNKISVMIYGKLYYSLIMYDFLRNHELVDSLDDYVKESLEEISCELYTKFYQLDIISSVSSSVAYFIERENLEDFHSSGLPLSDDIICCINKLSHATALGMMKSLLSPSWLDRLLFILTHINCIYTSYWDDPSKADTIKDYKEKVFEELYFIMNIHLGMEKF